MPRISVIITTFNRANFLKKAIESVLNQTYLDFELLILDNNSTDNTEEMVKSFNDERIRYIKHQPLNISQARNLGVKEARGEHIGFLDDDDEWLGNKLESQLSVFEKGDSNLGLVYGGFVWIDSQGREIKKHIPRLKGQILKDFLSQKDGLIGSASNPLLRKEVIEELGGYNEKVITGEDWELYLRLSEKYDIDFSPEILLRIRCHFGRRLGDKLKGAANLEKMVLERYKDIFDQDPGLKSFYLQKIGGKLCRIGQGKEGREYIKQAIKNYPFNFLAYFQFLFSFLGQSIYQKIHKIYKDATH